MQALNLAQNFSQCNSDTASLHDAWQRAMRAEERSNEALLEAWSATLTAAERLAVAFEDSKSQNAIKSNNYPDHIDC